MHNKTCSYNSSYIQLFFFPPYLSLPLSPPAAGGRGGGCVCGGGGGGFSFAFPFFYAVAQQQCCSDFIVPVILLNQPNCKKGGTLIICSIV